MQIPQELISKQSWKQIDETVLGLKKQLSIERRVLKNDALTALDTFFVIKEAKRASQSTGKTYTTATEVAHKYDD